MHSFQDLELKTLKKICSKYNLHVKIAKYSKLNKEQLIPHMEKHLHINSEGKIKMKKEAMDTAEDELSKLIHELKNKVKEVKEKVIKHHAKKEEKKVEHKPKKEIQIDDKEYKKKHENKQEKIDNEYFKYRLQSVERTLKGDLQPFHPDRILRFEKEEEILKAIPIYNELEKMKGIERNTKLQELGHIMKHFDSVAEGMQAIEEYLEEHKNKDKEDTIRYHRDEKNGYVNYKNYHKKLKEEKKEEKEKKEDDVKDIYELYKKYDKTKDLDERGDIETKIDNIGKRIGLKPFNLEFWDDVFQKYLGITPPPKKEMKSMSKEEGEKIMKMFKPIEKIDKIQNELNKLEQLIKIDEKQNEKEHKQLKKEIKESESDEEHIPMKPKKASDVLILKVSEVKDLARKHNISLKHKVNNKEVAKGGPMLKKEIIKYLKL